MSLVHLNILWANLYVAVVLLKMHFERYSHTHMFTFGYLLYQYLYLIALVGCVLIGRVLIGCVLIGLFRSDGSCLDRLDWTCSDWTGPDWVCSDWTGPVWVCSDWTGPDWVCPDWVVPIGWVLFRPS